MPARSRYQGWPRGIAVRTDGTRVFVGVDNQQAVFTDTSGEPPAITTIRVGINYKIGMNADGQDDKSVTIIDVSQSFDDPTFATVGVGNFPTTVVANVGSNTVTIIDTSWRW